MGHFVPKKIFFLPNHLKNILEEIWGVDPNLRRRGACMSVPSTTLPNENLRLPCTLIASQGPPPLKIGSPPKRLFKRYGKKIVFSTKKLFGLFVFLSLG